MDKINGVTIVGAGPAGIAAAMYLKRAAVRAIILEKDEFGGLLRNAYLVENYPGFPGGITGEKLIDQFSWQFHNLGLSIIKTEVKNIQGHEDNFLIETHKGRMVSTAVIVATGTIPKKLEIQSPPSIEGKRLLYEPGSIPLVENKVKKRILVIGAGDIAFDYALTLLHWGHKVTILSRSKPTCIPLLQERVEKQGATVHTMCLPEQIVQHRKDILLRCRKNNHVEEFSADFILVACGRQPNFSFLGPDLQKCFQNTADIPKTIVPGLYLAGDVIRGSYRQTGIAVGDGIHAAMMVKHYLEKRLVD